MRFEKEKRPGRLLRKGFCLALAAGMLLSSPVSALCDTEDGEEIPMDERAAEAQKEIRTAAVGKYGMVPIYGRDVADGVYDITVESSSPFFHIPEAKLYVENHEMRAEITIYSTSYTYVYPGTSQEAKKLKEADWTAAKVKGDYSVFTFPIEALNTPVSCAAYSKRRKRWYDRNLVFEAASLPDGALAFDLPDYELIEEAIKDYETGGVPEETVPVKEPEPVTLPMEDGEYSIEVNMTGGSGRASISSPTLLTVRDGKAYATLLWSSTYYDYMILEEKYYYNLTEDGGNSTFEIPITVMDEGMPVIADTTAMGDPVEIQYVLTFYEESIGTKDQIPQEAAKKVFVIAAVIIVAGGILNYRIKKKRK